MTLLTALDSEKLRIIMRECEQSPVDSTVAQPIIVRALVKPFIIEAIQQATSAIKNTLVLDRAQQHWPPALRQLHWELCASTQLRPIAKIMQKNALLPDVFVSHGGIWHSNQPLPHSTSHSKAGLCATVRLDVMLAGQSSLPLHNSTHAVVPGDAVLYSSTDATPYANSTFQAWTAFYYSTDIAAAIASNHREQ
jgi:hypothetical protein